MNVRLEFAFFILVHTYDFILLYIMAYHVTSSFKQRKSFMGKWIISTFLLYVCLNPMRMLQSFVRTVFVKTERSGHDLWYIVESDLFIGA